MYLEPFIEKCRQSDGHLSECPSGMYLKQSPVAAGAAATAHTGQEGLGGRYKISDKFQTENLLWVKRKCIKIKSVLHAYMCNVAFM